MHLFRLISSGMQGDVFIIGILEKTYVNSYQIVYPIEFNKQKDGSITHITPCNLSNLNNRIEQYSINIDFILVLYDVNEDFIPYDIKQLYINYLKLQYDVDYYNENKITYGSAIGAIDLDS